MYDYVIERTFVRLEERVMIGWSFFFMLVGVSTLASQVFRVVDYIEQPARHTRRHAAAR